MIRLAIKGTIRCAHVVDKRGGSAPVPRTRVVPEGDTRETPEGDTRETPD